MSLKPMLVKWFQEETNNSWKSHLKNALLGIRGNVRNVRTGHQVKQI